MDLFSIPGILAWQQRLNASADFAEAAAGWSGRLLLIETGDREPPRSAWVVVDDGRCAEARMGETGDGATADFILAASPDVWTDLATARITPAAAALAGRLSLRKGNVLSLIPHARAAAALLAAAAATPAG